eukprot:1153386-Pleurochrysis_carterae.AAC.1
MRPKEQLQTTLYSVDAKQRAEGGATQSPHRIPSTSHFACNGSAPQPRRRAARPLPAVLISATVSHHVNACADKGGRLTKLRSVC